MAIRLGHNDYGKSRVRLLRVSRHADHHEIRELAIQILFEGDFDTAHTRGDNRKILPTDTMKNTVYALARQYPLESSEEFGLHLIDHFLTYNPQTSSVSVSISEELWSRISYGGKPHATAFLRSGQEKRTADLRGTREGTSVRAGLADLVLLKTTKSAFEGFLRDPYTTLKEDRNRILATSVRASWLYGREEVEFNTVWQGARQLLLETFAEHDSQSLQQTLYAMGEAVLENFEAIREIRLSLPNKHFNLADLKPFGLENPAEVFVPTEEPHGLIEATIVRD
ncbi:MAG TPA: urate oxidase [Verrucomicrobiae bacterium]|nr:urate oxidase [Verrucomicrobiae bacterium]